MTHCNMPPQTCPPAPLRVVVGVHAASALSLAPAIAIAIAIITVLSSAGSGFA